MYDSVGIVGVSRVEVFAFKQKISKLLQAALANFGCAICNYLAKMKIHLISSQILKEIISIQIYEKLSHFVCCTITIVNNKKI